MINAGKLDRRLVVMARGVNVAGVVGYDTKGNPQDAYGEVIDEFGTLATVYGQRLDMRTQDAARAGGRDTYTTARYRIRYRADITTACRVQIDAKTYDVVAVDEPDRRAEMILTLEEVL